MGKLDALSDFKKKIDVEIKKYLDRVIKEAEKTDNDMAGALRHSKKIIMSGGKRARAAFMYYGYLAAGGKEIKKMLKASVSIELIHSFLLVHDDVIDQDSKRHGIATIHEYYKKIGKRFLTKRNPERFGVSMAIIVGDMLAALGNQALYESAFDPKLVVEALKKLQGIVAMTVIGESEDIHIEYRGKATVEEIIKMYEHKTARYTFEGPLHLGAILGGADEKFLSQLSRYAIPAGIAFQIQDDLLGVFGSEKKTGKPAGSDIRQGKYTLLVAKAYEKADKKQKAVLAGLLGKKNLNNKDIVDFQRVICETGAYDYVNSMSLVLVSKAKEDLSKMEIKKEAKDFLCDIADYMIEREL